jgi:hypothetical protein
MKRPSFLYSLYFTVIVTGTGCGQWERQYPCVVEGNDCEKTEAGYEEESTGNSEDPGRSEGKAGSRGPAGKDGDPGLDGATGPSGDPGESCAVTSVVGGALISCGDTSVLLFNGTDGMDGADGTNGQDGEDGEEGTPGTPGAPATAYPVTQVDPCGNHPTKTDEILLLIPGAVLRIHNDKYLVALAPGTYSTADGSGCNYTVLPDYSVSW